MSPQIISHISHFYDVMLLDVFLWDTLKILPKLKDHQLWGDFAITWKYLALFLDVVWVSLCFEGED